MIYKYLLAVLLFLFSVSSLANPIVVSSESHGVIYSLAGDVELSLLAAILVTAFALAVELAFLFLLRNQFKITKKRLLMAFPLIHIITFPVTQYLSFSLGHLAELFPIIVETLVYRYAGVFSVKSWQNFVWVAVANVLSWLVGHVYLWYILIWSN